MKRVICFFLAIVTVWLISAVSVSALDYGCDVETVSESVYLENLDTGLVIYTKNAAQKRYPASTTKIMTYVIVAENVEDFDDTMVPIKESVLEGLDPASTVMGLKQHIGEKYSIRDLLYGLMLPSGNDAALVLADYVGNGISGFVDMMNEKADELGCADTHFANPHGLQDESHYTTAIDMAKIAKYAMKMPYFMDITNTVSYTPARFDEPLVNTNYMINSSSNYVEYYYPNVRGIKTGYTDDAGRCLVTTAVKDDVSYLCVTMGADPADGSVNYAMKDTAALYDWVFANVSQQTVYGRDDVIKTVTVKNAQGESVLNLIPEGDLSALLPTSYDKSLVRIDIDCPDSVDAPISKGDVLGTVTAYYDDLVVGTTNIVASKNVEKDKSAALTSSIGEWIRSNILIVILIALFIIVVVVLIIVATSSNKKSKKRRQQMRTQQRRQTDRPVSRQYGNQSTRQNTTRTNTRSRQSGRRYRD